jgi:hypothetical protein
MTAAPRHARRRRSRAWLAPLALAASLHPKSARADVKECIDHHSNGQLLRDESRFIAARARFVSCAEATCPDAIRAECSAFLSELDRAIPTVVLAARDEQRRDVPGVRVELDGQPIEGALNGRAIPIDPGHHRFRFVTPDGRVQEIESVAQESIKARPIEVQFAAAPLPVSVPSPPPAPPTETPEPSATPIVAYVLGGVGLAALAGAGYFAWSGRRERQELSETCSPRCADEQVDPVRSKYLVADVLLALGVASIGTGAYFYFSTPTPTRSRAPVQSGGWFIGVGSGF